MSGLVKARPIGGLSGNTTTIIVPDSPISIAGTYISDLPSGDSLNIITTDQNDVPIVPISAIFVSGVLTIKINVPNCGINQILFEEPLFEDGIFE